MADRITWIIFLLVLGLSYIQAQIPQVGHKKFSASKEDLPFIRCSVCQKAVKHIKLEVSKMQANAGKKVGRPICGYCIEERLFRKLIALIFFKAAFDMFSFKQSTVVQESVSRIVATEHLKSHNTNELSIILQY